MKILMPVLEWENSCVRLNEGNIVGGVERFQKLVYENIEGIIPIYISYEERKKRTAFQKIVDACEEYSPNLIFTNTPKTAYSVAYIKLGIPIVLLNHDPGHRGRFSATAYKSMHEFNLGGGNLWFVSHDQHLKSNEQSKRMLGFSIDGVKGYVPSAYCEGDELVSSERNFDAVTIGRTETGKNPFWLHGKLKSSSITSCVLTSNPLTSSPNQVAYAKKNEHWSAPRTTIHNLSHAENMEILSKCGVYVSTCEYESWGITALEALSHGLPLILVTDASNAHASSAIADQKSDYRLIRRSISKKDFENLVLSLGSKSFEERKSISDRTKRKNTKEKCVNAVQKMLSL